MGGLAGAFGGSPCGGEGGPQGEGNPLAQLVSLIMRLAMGGGQPGAGCPGGGAF